MKPIHSIVLLAASLVLPGCGDKKPSEPPKPTNSSNATGNPITAPVDYLGAVAQAKKSMEKSIEMSSLRQTVQQFQAGEGRLPKSLDELVAEKYINSIPKPPYGLKIVYDPASGDVKIVQQ